MKFKNVCRSDKCKDKGSNKECLVGLPLFRGQIPECDLVGRMCPHCGEVQVVDQFDEIVSREIPGLTVILSLYNCGVLTGDMVSLDMNSGKAFIVKERGEDVLEYPAKGLEVKLPCYKKGVPCGELFKAFISVENGTIGGMNPHLFL